MSRQSTLPFVVPKRQRTATAAAAAAAAPPSSAPTGSSAATPIALDDDAADPELKAAIAESLRSSVAASSSASSSDAAAAASASSGRKHAHKGAGAAAAGSAAAAAPSSAASSSSSSSSSPSAGFRLEIRSGDLFSCPASTSLAHCVSQCLAMGKGIAVAFKSAYGKVAELKAQGRKVGEVAVLQPSKGKFVYYLITKPRYFHKPSYADLEASLAAMASHMAAHHVTALAMPRIGCGLDGLEWSKVEALIRKVFGTMHVSIIVFTGP